MRLPGCRHTPPCSHYATRWHCHKRSEIEAAMLKGMITEREGLKLLDTFGLPYSGPPKVYTGEAPKKSQGLW